MKFKSVEKQWSIIARGIEEIIPEHELKNKLDQSIESIKYKTWL